MYTLFRIMNMSSQDRDKTDEIVGKRTESNCKYNVIHIQCFIENFVHNKMFVCHSICQIILCLKTW